MPRRASVSSSEATINPYPSPDDPSSPLPQTTVTVVIPSTPAAPFSEENILSNLPNITPEQYDAYNAIVHKLQLEEAGALTRRLVQKYAKRGRVRSGMQREGDNIIEDDSKASDGPITRQVAARMPNRPEKPNVADDDRNAAGVSGVQRENAGSDRELHSPEAQVPPWKNLTTQAGPNSNQSPSPPRKRRRLASKGLSLISCPYPLPNMTNPKGIRIDVNKCPYGYLYSIPVPNQPRVSRGSKIEYLTRPAQAYPLPLVWPVALDELPPRPFPVDGSRRWSTLDLRSEMEDEIRAIARRVIEREDLVLPVEKERKWEKRKKRKSSNEADPKETRNGNPPEPIEEHTDLQPTTERQNDIDLSVDPDLGPASDLPLDPILPTSFLPRIFTYVDQTLLELADSIPEMTGGQMAEREQLDWEDVVRAAARGGRRDTRIAIRAAKRMQSLYTAADTGGDDDSDAPNQNNIVTELARATAPRKRKHDHLDLEAGVFHSHSTVKRSKPNKKKQK